MPILYSTDHNKSQDDVISKIFNSNLIVPSISIGNVPQLTVDLLVHNSDAKLVARLDPTFLNPFASPVDYLEANGTSLGTSTALELYYDEVANLSIIQQRAPILPVYVKNFIEYIVQFINLVQFKSITILDSNESALKQDVNFEKPIDIYTNDLTESFKNLKVSSNYDDLEKVRGSFTVYVQKLIESLDVKTTSLNALVMFVYEGDNFGDSYVFAKEVSKLLELESIQTDYWRTPKSWTGVYGDRPIPQGLEEGIYG